MLGLSQNGGDRDKELKRFIFILEDLTTSLINKRPLLSILPDF